MLPLETGGWYFELTCPILSLKCQNRCLSGLKLKETERSDGGVKTDWMGIAKSNRRRGEKIFVPKENGVRFGKGFTR